MKSCSVKLSLALIFAIFGLVLAEISQEHSHGLELSRSRRSIADDHGSEKDDIYKMLDTLEDTPWVVVAMNDIKRRNPNFTPRLGRYIDRELSYNPGLEERSYFAPRLGRYSPFSPRLGRFI